ncbi:hypothetical protein OIU83_21135 [Flavobacterium sp. LS1R49]|uniref:Uncharacterized protein n=1 Tax=Flavobacterium shii TaxID=2987687 RepID=A0A9X3C6T7_9FLAO|nr:hypothetical protein [Flavobacterium shii]MCV9930177.1 hypothetical protein [Flavobacterium shii]
MKTKILFSAFIFAMLYACNDKKGTTTTDIKTDSVSTTTSPNEKDTIIASERTDNVSSATRIKLVRNVLKNEIFKADTATIDAKNRKFTMYEFDLNGDGKKEIFVGFTGMDFCGNAGCQALLLSHDGKLITKFSIAQYPIIIAETKSKEGWRDLVITSRGEQYLVKWNGKKYPSNPSMEPRNTNHPKANAPKALWNNHSPDLWFSF